jgi:sialidase-1
MKKNRLYLLSYLFLLMLDGSCQKKEVTAVSNEKIEITSFTTATPIISGLNSNPQLRINIALKEANSAVNFKKIKCTINADAVGLIQKINVFFPNTITFSESKLIATITPTSTEFEIPINLILNSGNNYFWMNTTLKEDAEINKPIEIHCTEAVDANNKSYLITESNTGFSKLVGKVIRKAGDDGVNTYRIPGIITTEKGTLIAVYDNRYTGSGDLPGNIDVGMSRSSNGGKTWETMKIIMDMGPPHENNGIGDPSILFDPITNKIFVAALWAKGNRSIAGSGAGLTADETGQFVLVSSNDDGKTWTPPIPITPQIKIPSWNIFFNGPGKGIAMQNGKLVFPAQYWNETKTPFSTIIYSEDHGNSWKGKVLGPKSNTTESQVVETTPGTLMLNMRDNRGGFRSVATTSNMGTTWVEHPTSFKSLIDPVCMGSLIKAKVNIKGELKEVLFFSNPNNASIRDNITIKASLDLGETWHPANQLLIDERLCYGYSCLTSIDENTIAIVYEGTKDLYFLKVPVNSIIK